MPRSGPADRTSPARESRNHNCQRDRAPLSRSQSAALPPPSGSPHLGGFGTWLLAMSLLGFGTALVYPTLLAAISDVAHPDWRASAVGVYRLWRDGGYAIGALLAGVLADALGITWAMAAIAGLTVVSGVIVLCRMYETLPSMRPAEQPDVCQSELSRERTRPAAAEH